MADASPAPQPATAERWSRLASLGLVMAALGPLLMLAAGVVWGLDVGDEVPFFLVTGGVGLVASYLVRRPGVWSKVVGIVGALLVALALFWTAFGLASPASFFDFMPGVLVIPGALIAIGSSIAAIRSRRAGAAPAGDREPQVIKRIVTVVAALAVISGVLTFMSRDSVDEGEAEVTVQLSDFEFDSDEYTFAAGSTVAVVNDDPFLHTFTVEELDIDEAITPGSEKLIEIPDEPGEYVLFCRPHTSEPENPSEDDMASDLVVE
ncbi:MAG: cupredoxin domain-containing protein [Actinomycetota bacterium]|nr:cupredoxin domain-containing protein [Actinomycetota bacterium]